MSNADSDRSVPSARLEFVHAYFAALNNHDSSAVADVFADGGTYADPSLPDPVPVEGFIQYMGGLWAAFPDLAFETGITTEQDNRVVMPWLMTGTQTGPLPGIAPEPTGAAVNLPGIDDIVVGPGGIESVTGYFDNLTLVAQLGVPVQFG